MDGNSGSFNIVRSGTRTSRVYTTVTGWYNIAYTVQCTKSGTSTAESTIWIEKNGILETYSSNRRTLTAGYNTTVNKNNILYLNSGSYFEVMYQAESTTVSFPALAGGTTPATPASPSIILVITQHA
jgi:hypothetical protein